VKTNDIQFGFMPGKDTTDVARQCICVFWFQ